MPVLEKPSHEHAPGLPCCSDDKDFQLSSASPRKAGSAIARLDLSNPVHAMTSSCLATSRATASGTELSDPPRKNNPAPAITAPITEKIQGKGPNGAGGTSSFRNPATNAAAPIIDKRPRRRSRLSCRAARHPKGLPRRSAPDPASSRFAVPRGLAYCD